MRIDRSDGVALLIDYGQDGPYEMSLNAIRKHKAVHTLEVRLLLQEWPSLYALHSSC